MITVLYTREDTIYKTLNTDCWDKNRDARKWQGGGPIIAHPPCRTWGDYSHKAKPEPGEKQLAVHAIIMVRLWGGVVEHPKKSKLWKTMQIPKPGKPDHFGGWTLNVDQIWWGHRAVKNTTLYINGCKPKDIPAYPIAPKYTNNNVENMSKKEREATPPEFAKWLIKLAEQCKTKYNGLPKVNTLT